MKKILLKLFILIITYNLFANKIAKEEEALYAQLPAEIRDYVYIRLSDLEIDPRLSLVENFKTLFSDVEKINQYILDVLNLKTLPSDLKSLIVGLITLNKLDKEMVDSFGRSALMVAVERRHKDIAKLLIEAGFNVNSSDKSGFTPLFEASTNGDIEMVRLLINKSAEINAKADSGDTALDSAIINNHKNVVETLINSRADLKLINKFSIEFATKQGFTDILKLLKSHGVII